MSAPAIPAKPQKKTPCSPLPNFGAFSIPLPFGGELKSLVDPSKGPPTDCTLAHSLILQVMPMLSGLTCILKILNVISALEATANSGFMKVGDLLTAIGGLKSCFGFFDFTLMVAMIKAILQLILAYIGCLIQGVESIRKLKIGIDLNAEGGTPLLIKTLNCSSDNADTSMASLMSAMAAIEPLMKLVDMVAKIAKIDLGGELPKLNASQGGDDPLQPIIDFHDTLQEIVDKLPG